jgi:hypothetical protein
LIISGFAIDAHGFLIPSGAVDFSIHNPYQAQMIASATAWGFVPDTGKYTRDRVFYFLPTPGVS